MFTVVNNSIKANSVHSTLNIT